MALGRGPISSAPISGDAGAPAFMVALRIRAWDNSSAEIFAQDESRVVVLARDDAAQRIFVEDLSEGKP